MIIMDCSNDIASVLTAVTMIIILLHMYILTAVLLVVSHSQFV